MITVKATREGLLGQKTSTGYLITANVPFVALPSTAALRQWIHLVNPENGHTTRALVLDVGPWNEMDHAYVFQPATMPMDSGVADVADVRPQAESGRDHFGRVTNGAGIDLSEYVWNVLGMTDNGSVSWEFE